ncbi:hypothetical protein Y032_0131g1645 [Ancylostoma ceylanicum]|uniref:Vacuolar protein sorting-associated protein 11 homolog n=1 Tax=Ancylostoma ceylanicum TaxID=53326 RepID=A0A016T783_9BILA|nr:hypothetical protein Y032_0131g1645 [Ancylostoma ceylanicum]
MLHLALLPKRSLCYSHIWLLLLILLLHKKLNILSKFPKISLQMSVDFGWRRFNFFDKNVIQDPENPDEKFLGLKDVCVDCWCSGVGGEAAYLGESRGGVFRLGKNLDQYYWRAYQASLTALHAADKYIFSIGEDEEGTNSILRIWERDLHEKNAPVLKREVRLSALYSAGHGSVAACTVAVHSSLSSIAVGFVDGTVFVHQGDVIKDKNLNSRWLRIREASPLDGPVTGIALARLPGERLVVFVVTSKAVNSYVIENKAVSNMLKHDSTGASKDCWIFDERTGSLVVASRDMVFFYEADQCTEADGYRGRCLQLGRSHEKLQLLAIGEHLVLLTKQHALIPLFTVDQSLMILSKDGTLSELTEKNLNAKLDILFKKNLYDVAVILAKGSRDGTEHLKSIHAKYGDYLYGKGDFNNAVSEYKETIGMLEPSYVIKRYLDGSRLRQLCVYLEALHDTDRYTLHHTNILLNCYAQLEERKKMLKFLEKIANDGKTDMSSIFEVLRSLKMSEDASILAVKLNMHDHVLSMMVEDLGRYTTAIKYIGKRPPDEACQYIEKYGRLLFEACPDEVMELLQHLIENSPGSIDPAQLLKVFINDFTKSASFIEFALRKVSGSSRSILLATVLELRLREYAEGNIEEAKCADLLIPFIEEENMSEALHLARVFHCFPVVQYVLEKTGRKADMWQDLLVYISKKESPVDEKLIQEMLTGIEASGSLHPLVVLEILSRSNTLKVAAVKDYVIKWLDSQKKQIDSDRKAITEGERRMQEIDKQIESLKFNVQVLQVNKCSACDTVLQLPAVHFLCRHSYHVHCFESYSEKPDVCPACAVPATRESLKENLDGKAAYSKFHEEVCMHDLIFTNYCLRGTCPETRVDSGDGLPVSAVSERFILSVSA